MWSPLLPLLIILLANALNAAKARPALVLSSDEAEVTIDLGGGSIVDFHRGSDGLNPFQWDSWLQGGNQGKEAPLEPRPMGHFLCLDRWGPATEAERSHGMMPHGEAPRVWWEIAEGPKQVEGGVEATLSAKLPLAGLSVSRGIRLHGSSAVVSVTESVTNFRPLGRIYNIVQHPTIGPPFLDESVIVDTNGTRGFAQGGSLPFPESPEVSWPFALKPDGTETDMRRFSNENAPSVVSYVVDEAYGWVTALNASKGLLVGYIWNAVDYPWINLWRNARDGRPYARGLEFGTTGLHQPGPVLVEKGKIFDRKLFRFIDADETQRFSYVAFQAAIPEDFSGVERVALSGKGIVIRERGGKERSVSIVADGLFP